jgi:putative ABC transport system ATP-binding protein
MLSKVPGKDLSDFRSKKMKFLNRTEQNKPIITLKDIVKTFPVGNDEITVLHDISLDINPGEFVTIVGPSGNGKSTLLNMITGIDRPTSGEVLVTGQKVHKMSENQLAKWRGRDVGIIFQFFQMLPSLSLLQNITLPMEFLGKYGRSQRRERAMYLLEMVGLADQANKLPGMVSGGQQQRAAIARALATDPKLLVADEPTGNLDAQTAGQVFELFLKLVEEQGKTMLMVTHDKQLAARIPRKIEIVNGRIASDTARPAPAIIQSQPSLRDTVDAVLNGARLPLGSVAGAGD